MDDPREKSFERIELGLDRMEKELIEISRKGLTQENKDKANELIQILAKVRNRFGELRK